MKIVKNRVKLSNDSLRNKNHEKKKKKIKTFWFQHL